MNSTTFPAFPVVRKHFINFFLKVINDQGDETDIVRFIRRKVICRTLSRVEGSLSLIMTLCFFLLH